MFEEQHDCRMDVRCRLPRPRCWAPYHLGTCPSSPDHEGSRWRSLAGVCCGGLPLQAVTLAGMRSPLAALSP
jgi:hypothetical protein